MASGFHRCEVAGALALALALAGGAGGTAHADSVDAGTIVAPRANNPGTGRAPGNGGCQVTGTADGSWLVLLAVGLLATRRARRPLVTPA